MSNNDRDAFVNLFGLLSLQGKAQPGKLTPLFGSDDTKALVAPDMSTVAGHFVVYAKKSSVERTNQAQRDAWATKRKNVALNEGEVVVFRIAKRDPGGVDLPELPPRDGYFEVRPDLPEGVDPHVAFYQAVTTLRERFAAFSKDTLAEVPPEFRQMATLVTVVETPVHARPKGISERSLAEEFATERATFFDQDKGDPDEKGFDVACRFRQFVRLGGARSGIDGFEMYSEKGEYPVLPPSNVDMQLLMRIDKAVISQGPITHEGLKAKLAKYKT